jgi:selenocysteine lyase/cysteine desulfurase
VFTHASNVFGYVLPVEELASLCRRYGVPFLVDAAQTGGSREVSMEKWGADFVALPGHKGLLGPQGTGLLLCGREGEPLIHGGTGSQSLLRQMPEELPDRLEPGTLNVPGIAGLGAGLRHLCQVGVRSIGSREERLAAQCAKALKKLGFRVYAGENQGSCVSFVPNCDCEELAGKLGKRQIALRAGLHCAPLAHESAGTLETGTIRVSFGWDSGPRQMRALMDALEEIGRGQL